MPNTEHFEKIKQGVVAWNEWRQINKGITPFLSHVDLSRADLVRADLMGGDLRGANLSIALLKGADLIEADLSGADLSGTDLFGANLNNANLNGANLKAANLSLARFNGASLKGANLIETHLRDADLSRADLSGADLKGADLKGSNLRRTILCGANLKGADLSNTQLSGCIIDTSTKLDDRIIGCEKRVNGFYCKSTDSSALIRLAPPGNSMKGSNADVIVENLTYARKFHTYSIILAGIALLLLVTGMNNMPVPYYIDVKITPLQYSVSAILLSTCFSFFVAIFFNSAVQGTTYLAEQASILTVINFPWLLSKYKHSTLGRISSFILRLFLCFHLFIYAVVFLFSVQKDRAFLDYLIPSTDLYLHPEYVLSLISIPLFMLCGRIFYLSQRFQRPILFDPQTENERKDQSERLIEKVSTLVEMLQPTKSQE